MIAKRNARLADALGINAMSREKVASASYHEELVTFAQANLKFLGIVEKAFAEYVQHYFGDRNP
jgi:transcriptional repressor NF-X1